VFGQGHGEKAAGEHGVRHARHSLLQYADGGFVLAGLYQQTAQHGVHACIIRRAAQQSLRYDKSFGPAILSRHQFGQIV
jgi:hypothetical protein